MVFDFVKSVWKRGGKIINRTFTLYAVEATGWSPWKNAGADLCVRPFMKSVGTQGRARQRMRHEW